MDDTALAMARRFRRLAEERFPGQIEEIRIFGSYARDEARPGSDVDLFVRLPSLDSAHRKGFSAIAQQVQEEYDFALWLSPLAMSTGHFEGLLKRERKLARDIAEQGVPV